LQARAEESRGRTLEEAFEESLDGGQRRHGRSRSLAEGPGGTAVRSAGTIRRLGGVPPGGGPQTPCGILSPRSGGASVHHVEHVPGS
jgi:hypothetical protein